MNITQLSSNLFLGVKELSQGEKVPGTKVGGDLSSIPGDYMVKKKIDAHKLCPHLYVCNICVYRYVYTDTLNK